MFTLKSKSIVRLLGLLLMILFQVSCDDNTGDIGQNIMPNVDKTNTTQSLYYACTKSFKVDSLFANTSNCYLGKVTDPETGATTTCNFLAQFFCQEDYALPSKKYMKLDENGDVVCDSVDIRLFIKSYYGDSLNSMKIAAVELDSAKIMAENANYYTNFNPTPYISSKADAIYKETSFSVVDLEESDSIRSLSTYSRQIKIKLPTSYGKKILNTYYKHPDYFQNTYKFIHNVVPGFYFKSLSGNGTLVNIDASTLNVYFQYSLNDSVIDGLQRVASTAEVLQNNVIGNTGIEDLVNDQECTYLKTPAGVFTEAELPVESIFEGHENDSICGAKIVFQRINNKTLNKYSLPTASSILLMPKAELESFFEKIKLPDGKKEFIVKFVTNTNSYTFENIGTLLQWMYDNMQKGAGITKNDSKEQRKAKLDAWKAKPENKDWNKIALVPIKYETNSTGAYTKIYNDLSMTSTKLVGGANNPVQLSVVYSKFNQ